MRMSPARIERIWLFNPREINGKESGLVVLSLLPPQERPGGLRQVVTWRYEAERARGKLLRRDAIAEEGWAPAERIQRVIEGVLARLGDATENPIMEAIGGDEARWNAFTESLGMMRVDSTYGE